MVRRIERIKRRAQFIINLAFFALLAYNVIQFAPSDVNITSFTTTEEPVEPGCELIDLYYDSDGDGYGDNAVVDKICSKEEIPIGYTEKSNDCDDSNPSVWQAITAYEDHDQDGYSSDISAEICTNNQVPKRYLAHISLETDCDDHNKLLHPDSDRPEITGGPDYNCNGYTDLPLGGIFVTSVEYKGDLGGTSGANNICNELAAESALSGDWIALLSDSQVDLQDKLPKTSFVNAYQLPVARDIESLFAGWVQTDIKYTEKGTIKSARVWTATGVGGEYGGNSCSDWLSSGPDKIATTGSSRSALGDWISQKNTYCSNYASLYCVRVG